GPGQGDGPDAVEVALLPGHAGAEVREAVGPCRLQVRSQVRADDGVGAFGFGVEQVGQLKGVGREVHLDAPCLGGDALAALAGEHPGDVHADEEDGAVVEVGQGNPANDQGLDLAHAGHAFDTVGRLARDAGLAVDDQQVGHAGERVDGVRGRLHQA